MSDFKNKWRCPYCDALNDWQDEICQVCDDGRRPSPEPIPANPEIPKIYTPQERPREAPAPERTAPPREKPAPAPAEPAAPAAPRKKGRGLIWALVIAALAYFGGRMIGGDFSQRLSGSKPAAQEIIAPKATATAAAKVVKATQAPTAKPTKKPTAKPTKKPTAKPTAKPTPEPVALKRGDSGDEVARLQMTLVEHHYLADKADGQFGGKTEAAVKAVQADAGLTQTGVADGATQAYLQDHDAGFTAGKENDLLMYAATYDAASGDLDIHFINLGKERIDGVELRVDQCSQSKAVLGDFYGRRNTSRNTWWINYDRDFWLYDGSSGTTTIRMKEGSQSTFVDGSTGTVTFYDNGYYARVILKAYTNRNGKRITADQTVYCRIR